MQSNSVFILQINLVKKIWNKITSKKMKIQDIFPKEIINIPLSTSLNNSNNPESYPNLPEDKLARLLPQ